MIKRVLLQPTIYLLTFALFTVACSDDSSDKLKDATEEKNGSTGQGGGKMANDFKAMGGQGGKANEVDNKSLRDSDGNYVFDKGDQIFQDGTPLEVMTDSSHHFMPLSPLRVEAVGSTYLQIVNFAPIPLENVRVYLSISGGPQRVHLLQIKSIRAHGIVELEYPFMGNLDEFLDDNGKAVDLLPYNKSGIRKGDVSFEVEGDSPLLTAPSSSAELLWKFLLFEHKGNAWVDDLAAQDARLYCAFLINMAHLFRSKRFEEELMRENLFVDGSVAMTDDDKKALLENLRNQEVFRTSVSREVPPHASKKEAFGVSRDILSGLFLSDDVSMATHIMGHRAGYGHKSNVTAAQEDTGLSLVVKRVKNEMLQNDEFPITTDNYYSPEDLK